MYCPTCGRRNSETARFCGNCGQTLQERAPREKASIPEPTLESQPLPPTPEPSYESGPGYGPFRDAGVSPTHVPNYLIQAILATLFCCVPFGIVAIVYAAQVNGKVAMGDMEGAWRTSRRAKSWAWISFGVGLVITVGWVILVLVGAGGSESVLEE